jgi:hypothetical protein
MVIYGLLALRGRSAQHDYEPVHRPAGWSFVGYYGPGSGWSNLGVSAIE